jgi:hypothetical protein
MTILPESKETIMEDSKPWYASVTIWGSLVSASAAFATLMAVLPDARTEPEYARAMVSLLGAAGSLVAIHGRISARRPIS